MLNWNLSYNELTALQRPILARQVARLRDVSQFYRARWSGTESFQQLPLVTKKDLHEALSAGFLGNNLCVTPRSLSHIHTSSGTSGRPTYFGLTNADYEAWVKVFDRGFSLAGVRPGDRVLHAFAMSRGYAGAVPMVDALYRMGCAVLPMGAEAGSARLVDALQHLAPDVLYCSPSMARHLAKRYQELARSDPSDTCVRLLITGGEPGAGDPASRAMLGATWGAEVHEMGGGTDVCPMMVVECEEHDGMHFIAGDEVALEVVDPDTGSVIESSGMLEGEVVYSHLHREANPVVRMRHGDVIALDPAPCACGLKAPRLRFLGRSDDLVIVRGVKVYPSGVHAVVAEFSPPLSGTFRIERDAVRRADGELVVLCECPDARNDELGAAVARRAREVLGVRVHCRLVPENTFMSEGEQKGAWYT